MKSTLLLLVLLTASCLAVLPARATGGDDDAIKAGVRRLLKAYSDKDLPGVMALVAPDEILMMGSDLAEISDTREKVEAILKDDFLLWTTASFGHIAALSIKSSGGLASAFYEVPFTVKRGSGRPETLVVRFATVWRLQNGEWKLIQLMNAVPTVGESAKEMLRRIKGGPKPPAKTGRLPVPIPSRGAARRTGVPSARRSPVERSVPASGSEENHGEIVFPNSSLD
jgi:ketosteroid isomerase-like protein